MTNLGTSIASVASDVAKLAGTATAGLPPPLDEPAFWESLAGELLGVLLSDYLESHLPALFGILRFLGIAVSDQVAAAGSQGAYARSSIDWSKLTSAAGQPGRVFADVYGWARHSTTRDSSTMPSRYWRDSAPRPSPTCRKAAW